MVKSQVFCNPASVVVVYSFDMKLRQKIAINMLYTFLEYFIMIAVTVRDLLVRLFEV